MSLPILYPFIGQQYNRPILQIINWDGTAAANIYTSGTVLSATFWEGQSQASLFSPTVTWYTAGSTQTGYGQGQFTYQLSGAQTVGLDPAGEYYTLISQTTLGITSPVWEGRVKMLATPGSAVPTPPDLVTYDFVESYLTRMNLTDSERDLLPYLIGGACDYLRKWCGSRDFSLLTYTEEYYPEYDGTIALRQMPVQFVSRARGYLQTALNITNTSSANQIAYVQFSYAGDFTANTQVTTGLILTTVASGVTTVVNLLWTSYALVSLLAAAITQLGNGWTTLVDVFGLWPVTELQNGYASQGAVTGDAGGVDLQVYSQDLAWSKLNQRTGVMAVGSGAGGGFALGGMGGFRGGYDWAAQDAQDDTDLCGRVLVTYTAGFTTIPMAVQQFTAELVKASINRFRRDYLLRSEHAGQYSYEITDKDLGAMPIAVKEQASLYRIRRIA
jgi:hypothetical protein